jgi:hypothetical protein
MGAFSSTIKVRAWLGMGSRYVRRDVRLCQQRDQLADLLATIQGLGFVTENDTECANNPLNDYPLASTACTSSADSRCDSVEGVPDWLSLGREVEGGELCQLSPVHIRKSVG